MVGSFFLQYARLLMASAVLSLLASGLIPWGVLLQIFGMRGINTILATLGQPTGGAEVEVSNVDWDCNVVPSGSPAIPDGFNCRRVQ